MAGVPGVKEIHDLHIWTITSGLDALSAHVVVSVGEDRDEVLELLQRLLRDRFKVDHATLQVVEERSDRVQVE
jgi:cobalt-zinc-cadmium efflux system protein